MIQLPWTQTVFSSQKWLILIFFLSNLVATEYLPHFDIELC